MDLEELKDLYIQVTEDYAYIQGIILKNENKEEEQLLIITPDYIEKKEQMVFCQRENKNYVIGNRGGCWGLKLQNISKKSLIVRFSKDKEEIANMLLRPGSKYFMNNYNMKGKNYFEIQESESTQKTVQETIQEGTFDKHKNEYELYVFPVERLVDYEGYKYSLDDFIKKKESKFVNINELQQKDIKTGCEDSFDYGVQDVCERINEGSLQGGMSSIQTRQNKQKRFCRVENVTEEKNGMDRQRAAGNFLEDSKHTMHKMSERRNEEKLQTTDISEQLDQCMKLQFVVIIKKTLEVNIIDSESRLVEMLDSQLQKRWAEQVSENKKYVQDECIVCYNKSEKVFAKCGHGCTCQNCYQEFKRHVQRTCPLCRSVIQGVFSI